MFNFAIPMVFIALGVAADEDGRAWSDLAKNVVSKVMAVAEAAAEGPLGDAVTSSVALPDMLLAVANCAGSLLLGVLPGSRSAESLFTRRARRVRGRGRGAVPGLGRAGYRRGGGRGQHDRDQCRGGHQPGDDVDHHRAHPGRGRHGRPRSRATRRQWPATATHYTITITYDDGPVHAYAGQLDPSTQQGPIGHTFTGLPSGGNITVLACFYAATGWLAGKGDRRRSAQPGPGRHAGGDRFEIKENLVPLSAATTYTLKEKLDLRGPARRSWAAPPAASAPTATVQQT